jgi:hypothetical protein
MTETPSPSPESVFNAAGGRTERIRQVHPPTLRDWLSIEAWSKREIDEPEKLLGELVSRTSRAFFVGTTGLGKTMFGFALACGMAAGTGFLHWRSAKPARVLYIDGEMPAELIKVRSLDALRRLGVTGIPAGNLTIFARDMEDKFAAAYPSLGRFAPLNKPDGLAFIKALIEALGGVDVVIFDNVMSLLAGDQREEIPWSDTLPLVEWLTKERIGQVWLDHTGHNSTRQYGSSTKAWRFDTLGVMEPMPEGERSRRDLAFKLSFDAPNGKARRRTPANWQDFEPCTIRLVDDVWTSELAEATSLVPNSKAAKAKLNDKQTSLRREIEKALDEHGVMQSPGTEYPTMRTITRKLLRSKLIRGGWFTENELSDNPESKTGLNDKGFKTENNVLTQLKNRNLFSFTQDHVWAI